MDDRGVHGVARKILHGLSILSAILYLINVPWQPYPGAFVIKGLSVGPLAALAFVSGSPILGLALALSTVGDVLLDVDPDRLFVYGLGSFLVAHLVYIFLFVRKARRPMVLDGKQKSAVVLLLLYSAGISAWLLPNLGSLIVPVAIYMCAITVMVESAILARFSTPWVAIGAVLFLVSDSLLAIHKFKTPIPYRDFLVWSTYYAGQYSIAMGILRLRAN
jgi:uncharacterized membrane protein YhhN